MVSFLAMLSLATVFDAPAEPESITGGVTVGVCEWPSAVAMVDNTGFPFCTATLIDPEVVLFAAHCMEAVSPYAIAFGEDGNSPARQILVTQCTMHPQYQTDFVTDLAYCKLQSAVDDVDIVPPLMGCEADELVVGGDVTIIGYGSTQAGWDDSQGWVNPTGGGPKRRTQQTVESIVGVSLTLRGTNAGGCPGDSGGPAMLQLSDGSWRVLGAASTVHPDSPFDQPNACGYGTVYALAHPEMSWLEGSAGKDVTPCHDANGNWDPDERCAGFPMAPNQGGGTWATGCSNGQLSGPSEICGPGNPAPGTTAGEGGSEGGTDGEPGGSTGGADGFDESSGSDDGFDDDGGSPGGIPQGLPPVPPNRRPERACNCTTDAEAPLWSLGLFGLVALGARRRRKRSARS